MSKTFRTLVRHTNPATGASGRVLAAVLFAGLAFAPPAQSQNRSRHLIRQKCSTCHNLDVAVSGKRSAREWSGILEAMVGHGMKATPRELGEIHGFLRRNRGKAALKAR